jgi:hypothetical protein
MVLPNHTDELVENMKCLVNCNYSRDTVVREVSEFIFANTYRTTSFERQEILENILELIYNE